MYAYYQTQYIIASKLPGYTSNVSTYVALAVTSMKET